MFQRFRSMASLAIAAMLGFTARAPLDLDTAVAHVPNPKPKARPRAARNKPRGKRHGSAYSGVRTQLQEMARRVRQIERGQLTASNGLVSVGLFRVNSHGKAVAI